MKASRLIVIPLSLFLPLLVASPLRGTEYSGTAFSWVTQGTYTSTINVPDTGTVSNVSVFIRDATTQLGFDNNAMILTSPSGTNRYLFELSVYQISGTSLYLTRFIDSAPVSITDGIPPYAGSFRPGESFSAFIGEEMAGEWTLAVYNDRSGPGNAGAVTDWSLIINDDPPPPDPAVYREYHGDFISWTGVATKTSIISIGNQGQVEDLNVKMNVTCSASLDPVGMYLISPLGSIVDLFNKTDLEGTTMYLTTFDDSASRSIKNGITPYIGLHRPVASLALINDESVTGDWTLVAFNDDAANDGTVSDWSLILAIGNYQPTPPPITPTPTVVPTTTPSTICYTYSGGWVQWTQTGIVKSEVIVEDVGTLVDLEVTINNAYTDYDFYENAMYIQSPAGTYSYLFIHRGHIVPYPARYISGNSLYQTNFNDAAFSAITEGSAPYTGSFRPVEELSKLYGDTIQGVWTLVVYNDSPYNQGYVEDWSFKICVPLVITPTPTVSPPTPTPIAPSLLVLQSGDYDGDGTSDIGVFRPSSGLWSVRGVGTSFFGRTGDIPASGDYSGDGMADITIFRPSSGLWAVHGVTRVYFGRSGDPPVPADYTGDGFADIGIFRPSTGLWAVRGLPRVYFGTSGDIPVPGDYTGDGFAGPAVFRPSTGLWAARGVTRVYFGGPGDLPLARDFSGDGTTDIGIFRPSTGLWAIRGLTRFHFGVAGDYPVAADFRGDWIDYPGIFRRTSGLWAIRGVTRVYYGQPGDIPVAR